ncbi:MAG: hypothetical protein QGH98_06305 [Nitrospinaceae bacterium]|jgi:hypothetical protein|nr:hypothetical protein [Nitrospinaceae bacterium]|tara:strand:+ start:163 stop:567 length:405 start_codon:yes stop_codon:yes gene_type:complete
MSDYPTGKKALKSFGFLMGGVLSFIGAILLYKGKMTAVMVFGGLATVFILPALIRPSLLAGVHAKWMKFAEVIGTFNAKVILSAMYMIVFTLSRAMLFVLRKDLLQKKFDPSLDSYWSDHEPMDNDPKRYEKQF